MFNKFKRKRLSTVNYFKNQRINSKFVMKMYKKQDQQLIICTQLTVHKTTMFKN